MMMMFQRRELFSYQAELVVLLMGELIWIGKKRFLDPRWIMEYI
jgi:hypothetical protein